MSKTKGVLQNMRYTIFFLYFAANGFKLKLKSMYH